MPKLSLQGYGQISLGRGAFMFWTGVVVGLILGGNIGIVIGCVLASSKRKKLEHELDSACMDVAVMDEENEAKSTAPRAKRVAYAESNPYAYSQHDDG
jgi:hypothetical protein